MSDDKKDVEKIAAMVDFYSDRAVAHASFFLAILFGLFTILTIASDDKASTILYGEEIAHKTLWAIPYWILFLASCYTLLNFRLYANYAQRIAEEAQMYEIREIQRALKRAKRTLTLQWLQILKNTFSSVLFGLGAILYAAIVFLSCCLSIGRPEAIIGLAMVSAVIAVAWLCVLYSWDHNS